MPVQDGVQSQLLTPYLLNPTAWIDFVMATNTMIDIGFVAANLVAFILFNIFGQNHLQWVWRLTLGLGAIPPLAVLFFRVKMEEPEHYKRGAIKRNVPWLLIIRKYWLSLSAVCIAWFICEYLEAGCRSMQSHSNPHSYVLRADDWVSYPASLYSSYFVAEIVPDGDLFKSLGWATLINAFYLPGTFAGALVCDRIGPKNTMLVGLLCQAVIGFGLAGGFGSLKNNLPGIVILYGIYVAFGEVSLKDAALRLTYAIDILMRCWSSDSQFGPGNNLGLLASKAVAPSAVRGTFYGIAAAIGKVGAFTGSYLYTEIQSDLAPEGPSNNLYYSGPFYIGSALAIVSAVVTFFFIPQVVKDGMAKTDKEFEGSLLDVVRMKDAEIEGCSADTDLLVTVCRIPGCSWLRHVQRGPSV